MKKVYLVIAIVFLLASGCTRTQKYAIVGAAIGGLAGSAIGNTAVGAIAGGAVGGAAGYVVDGLPYMN